MNKPLTVTARVTIVVDPDAYNREYGADWTRYDIRDIVKRDIEDGLKTGVFRHLLPPSYWDDQPNWAWPLRSIEVT